MGAVEEKENVFVIEGEKDVHTLEEWDLTATTNPMGAGKWRASYGSALEGAQVVVVPDNDETGQRHAEKVAESLSETTAEVRIVELRGLGNKGDVTDWREAGGTREKLLELVQTADVYQPERSSPPSEQPKPKKGAGGQTQAQELISIGSEAELFHTPEGKAYASFPLDGHPVTHPIRRGGKFTKWLRMRFFNSNGKPPGAQALQDAKNHLAAVAELRAEEREVHLRTAGYENAIHLSGRQEVLCR